MDHWYEIGNVIAVVNAGLEETLSDQAEFLLASEVADAGSIVLSRSQEVPVTKQDATIEHLNRSLVKFGCRRQIKGDEVLRSPWNEWTEREFERVLNGGYCTESYRKPEYRENQGFQSLYYMNLQIKKEELKEKIKEALKDLACGKLFRIKGFMQDENEKWIELNATQYEIQMNPVGEGQNVLIVIGEGLEEDALAKYFGTPAR